MKKFLCAIVFTAASLASEAQVPSALISEYQHLIRYRLNRIAELKVNDTLFQQVADTLTRYSTDPKFNAGQQVENLQGLLSFLGNSTDKEQLRSGKYTDMLLFAFSVMDWRKDGILTEEISSYPDFAIRCASFFAKDSAAERVMSKVAAQDPDQILINADQVAKIPNGKATIENAILQDPDFARRYFFGENTVSGYASSSSRKEVADVFNLFEKFTTKTKAFILFDAVENGVITAHKADSISIDNRAMIRQMVRILKKENPMGLKSTVRELDYRAVGWVRQSTLWNQGAVKVEFNRFTTDEKLVLLTFGYRECSPQLLDYYLANLLEGDLSEVSPTLIQNLNGSPLSEFLHFLDRQDKVTGLLSAFNETNTVTLSQIMATDEVREEQPKLRIVSPMQVPPDADLAELRAASRVAVKSLRPETKPEPVSVKPVQPKEIPVAIAPAKVEQITKVAPIATHELAYEDVEVEPIHIPYTDSSRALLGLEKNIYLALQDIPSFLHQSYAKEAMMYAAAVEPDEVFKKVDMFKSKFWCRDILEEATLNAPISARRYLGDRTHPVTAILSYSVDSTIRMFMKLSREAEYQSKPFLLLDEIANGCLTLGDATTISRDNGALFREMMNITTQKNYIGRFNVEKEMNYYALKYVRAINDKVALPEKERYESVDGLSCVELYYLMVYGREEVFSGTFDGLFSRFKLKCSTSGFWNASLFVTYPHYRSFIAMCAAYNMLDRFLALFSSADQKLLMTSFASGLEKERNPLADGATVAETVANTTNTNVLSIIQNTIKASYIRLDSAHNYNGMAIYGILAAMCKDKAATDRKWFVLTAKKYKTTSLTTLSNASLMDQKVFIERMYFYDDEDGRESYKNFITTYSASPNWRVEQFFSYVKVSSLTGNKIQIYANKAELEESGDREITKIVSDNNYTVRAIVHRGHSFHTESTLSKVPGTAKFIFVGSCGGFYKINIALRKAPDAQIISTRQIGVKEINDPIIYSFNEYVRQGKDINWKTFWDEMKAKLGSNELFNDYVPPHKNLESLFVRAYYEIMGG